MIVRPAYRLVPSARLLISDEPPYRLWRNAASRFAQCSQSSRVKWFRDLRTRGMDSPLFHVGGTAARPWRERRPTMSKEKRIASARCMCSQERNKYSDRKLRKRATAEGVAEKVRRGRRQEKFGGA